MCGCNTRYLARSRGCIKLARLARVLCQISCSGDAECAGGSTGTGVAGGFSWRRRIRRLFHGQHLWQGQLRQPRFSVVDWQPDAWCSGGSLPEKRLSRRRSRLGAGQRSGFRVRFARRCRATGLRKIPWCGGLASASLRISGVRGSPPGKTLKFGVGYSYRARILLMRERLSKHGLISPARMGSRFRGNDG